MSMHSVMFSANVPEMNEIQIEMDPKWDKEEKEAEALEAIKEIYPEYADIEITKIEVLN